MSPTPSRRASELRTLTRNALRRSPGTALVLVLFVALCTMLAASAGALVLTSTGAASGLMHQARAPHFLQMHAGPVDEERMADFAASQPSVEDYAVVPMLNVDGASVRITGPDEGPSGGTTLAAGMQDNSFVAQNPDFDQLLDTEGQVIEPAPGTVWLPLYYLNELGVEVGDTVTVTGPEETVRLSLAGFLRDAQMNSSYASSKRLLVAPADLATLTAAMGPAASIEHLVEFRLTSPDAVGQLEADYRAAGLESNGPTLTWSLFLLANSLSEGILAAVVVLVTLLLVAIALLCVRFTLLTTIEQDYREIGVLKAIGVRDRAVRRLYLHRYLAMALLGATVGVVASWGLSYLLLAPTRQMTGPSGRTLPSMLLGVALAALVVGVVLLTVRRTLRRTELVSPVEAIRSGAASTGRTRTLRPPRWLSVADSRLDTGVLLGLRDLLARTGLYVVPLVIFALASFILAVPQALYSTVTRSDFVTYMGVGVSDLRADVQQLAGPGRAAELAAELEADPRVARHAELATAAYLATDPTGKQVTVKIESGDLATFPVAYQEGRSPAADGEIGLSRLQADALGAGLGDTVEVAPVEPLDGAGPLDLVVTGIYQDISNGGRTAKMVAPHTSGQLMWTVVYADLVDGADVPTVVAELAAANPDVKVSSVQAYVDATLGGTVRALGSAALVSAGVGLAVAALITGLFMRLLMARDAFAIAVQRAIGVRDRLIQRQYVVRGITLLVAGVVVGTVLAALLGGGLAGAALSPVGLSSIRLATNPWLVYLLTPAALLAVVVAATTASTRPARGGSLSTTLKD